MQPRSSARMRARRLVRLSSARRLKFVRSVITAHLEGALQTKTNEVEIDQRNISGSATPNSTQSRMRPESAFLLLVVLFSSRTLLAWIALVQSSKLESCVSSPATQEQTFSSDGSNTLDAPRHSSKSAKLIM